MKAVKAKAQQSEPALPGLAQARLRRQEGKPDDDVSGMLPLVDALALLAADLWFAGKLDHFPLDEVAADVEDE